jgi:hypothetical protein
MGNMLPLAAALRSSSCLRLARTRVLGCSSTTAVAAECLPSAVSVCFPAVRQCDVDIHFHVLLILLMRSWWQVELSEIGANELKRVDMLRDSSSDLLLQQDMVRARLPVQACQGCWFV